MLKKILNDLSKNDFKEFKWHMQMEQELPREEMDEADRVTAVRLMMGHFQERVLDMTIHYLMKINRNDLAQRLSHQNPEGSETFRYYSSSVQYRLKKTIHTYKSIKNT